jgi:hypothetical protein
MSQQHSQTGTAAIKPTVPSSAPAQKTAPVPLDSALLRQVSGGTPKGTW